MIKVLAQAFFSLTWLVISLVLVYASVMFYASALAAHTMLGGAWLMVEVVLGATAVVCSFAWFVASVLHLLD